MGMLAHDEVSINPYQRRCLNHAVGLVYDEWVPVQNSTQNSTMLAGDGHIRNMGFLKPISSEA